MFDGRYSTIDRAVHRIAFATYGPQTAVAAIEDRLYAKRLTDCDPKRPLFISGLPRAGTTLLLECLASHPLVACHQYNDMPFVLIPLLWQRFASRHRRQAEANERAHGDGMTIDINSPEALEEILWKSAWPQQYIADRIRPWPASVDREFQILFRNHMRKIIYLRRGDAPSGVRYASKNNLNIARLGLLRAMFPDGIIIVPFRRPLQHAASLLKQHRNFLQLQDSDPFTLEYMSAIGHFDFGHDLRPVDFDHWVDQKGASDPMTLDYWLEYWLAAYRHITSEHREDVTLVSYEALCAQPRRVLLELGARTGISDLEPSSPNATIHGPTRHNCDADDVCGSLLRDAEELYSAMCETAL